jgi:uncharacterized Zn finger protein
MTCDYHFHNSDDEFLCEVIHKRREDDKGIFYGILYRCSECGQMYFLEHCDVCEHEVDECGCE